MEQDLVNGNSELKDFVSSSGRALELKFVRSEDDFFDDDLGFSPDFTHQVFGDNEAIFGYKQLRIQLYYTPDHLDTYLGVCHEGKVDPEQHDGVVADDITGKLSEWLPTGYYTSKEKFLSVVCKAQSSGTSFTPNGELLHCKRLTDGTSFELYKADVTAPGFKDYFQRWQMFVIWFIDAASFIDLDDDKWTIYLVYERQQTSEGGHQYAIVGHCTVYNFYSYPDKVKPRISQMLVLPPYQRKGLGSTLLETVYNDLVPQSDVDVITVEDPSEGFTCLRDYVDCKRALSLTCLQRPAVLLPYSKETENSIQKKLKLHKHQCRKVYEILRLKAVDCSDSDEYRQYRLLVKNRLNIPYQRQQRDLSRIRRLHQSLDPVELAVTFPQQTVEERRRELHSSYQDVELEYKSVLEKLAAS